MELPRAGTSLQVLTAPLKDFHAPAGALGHKQIVTVACDLQKSQPFWGGRRSPHGSRIIGLRVAGSQTTVTVVVIYEVKSLEGFFEEDLKQHEGGI